LFLLYTSCHHLILLLPPWMLPDLMFPIPTTIGFLNSVLLDMFREFVHDLQASRTSGKHISAWYILFVSTEIWMQNVLLHYFLSRVTCHKDIKSFNHFLLQQVESEHTVLSAAIQWNSKMLCASVNERVNRAFWIIQCQIKELYSYPYITFTPLVLVYTHLEVSDGDFCHFPPFISSPNLWANIW